MTNFDISALETLMISTLKAGGVSANVYPNRPKSTDKHQDFVTVMVSGNTEDMATYAEGRLYITLFSKDVEGIKNGVKLGVMYGKLAACMPVELGRYLIDTNPTVVGDRADDYGFHARIVNFKFTIKIQ